MMSIKTNFDPAVAGDFNGCVLFRFGDTAYFADVREQKIVVQRGEPASADVIISCDPDALKPVLYGGAPVEMLQPEGDLDAARRFMTLFSLPPKVG